VQKEEISFSAIKAGLPDGLFSKQKSKFGEILEGLVMKIFGILEHFIVICYISCSSLV
jgi:hypothetical protein